MEKYSYLITKHTAQKKCMCKNFFLRPQADRFVRLFVGRLRWIQQDARTSSVVFTFIDIIISLKILQTKLFNKSDQGKARRYAQRLNRSHYRLAIFSFASFLSFSGDFYRFWQFSFVSLLSVAVWRSFTNDHRVILQDRRKHVKIYSDNKIAVPLSVFVSRSLIYTLGT